MEHPCAAICQRYLGILTGNFGYNKAGAGCVHREIELCTFHCITDVLSNQCSGMAGTGTLLLSGRRIRPSRNTRFQSVTIIAAYERSLVTVHGRRASQREQKNLADVLIGSSRMHSYPINPKKWCTQQLAHVLRGI
jgi:hypothetical protein